MRVKLQPEPLRGFRDVFGELADAIYYIMRKAERLAERWGYEKCLLPTVERFELFAMKSGEEIKRTMFVFEDKAKRVVALRPEATASVVRAYLHSLRARPKPVKLFTIVNVFRYDEPQYARYREFYQADFEVIGNASVLADAELLTMLHDFYEEIGLEHEIVLGSVKALRSVLEEEGVRGDEQDHVLHLIDKGKVDEALNIVKSKAENPERAAAAVESLVKAEGDESVVERGKEILSSLGYSYAFEDLGELLKYLPEDVKKVIRIKLGFARGLAYYTGIIYEVKVPGFPVSVAGGGRYDTLTEVYGWERVPATGFAIGVDRTALAMVERVGVKVRRPRVLVVPICEECRKKALELKRTLSALDVDSLLMTEIKSLRKSLAYANEVGVDAVVMVGKKDLEEGKVTIKNLKTGRQTRCDEKEFLDCVVSALKGQ